MERKKREDWNIGVVIKHASLYPDFTGLQNLRYLAQIKKRASETDIREAIEQVGLNPDDKRNFRKYSLGMKQRLGIELFYHIVKEEVKRGAIICIASDIMENIIELCDKVYSMKSGKLESI